ncbi:hypothetical protein EI546_08265 [Aequorivita sp. H23M31]|uniref:Uncharacterized protein n=1 Tax=Aequorivita ciconiae TaxID=2494375 RepID=A0A410G354_9FLAO|nr:hypothetical protein [Aequorivita sp. H23M31]QAA81718.1 hypothetical protein EI546_08265 [Aequorivita sp. H23M31]
MDVQVKFEKETGWLSLNQISELFDKDKSVISRHIKNVFKVGELERNSVIAKNATVLIIEIQDFSEKKQLMGNPKQFVY